MSAKKFRTLRARVLRQAEGLWAALRPDIKVSARPDEVSVAGARTLRRSVFVQPDGERAYEIVQTESAFTIDGKPQRWYTLRAQCGLSVTAQFGIWFIDGECQFLVIVADREAIDHVALQLRAAKGSLFTDQTLCGSVHAYLRERHTLLNACIGRTGPTRLREQEGPWLWPQMRADSRFTV